MPTSYVVAFWGCRSGLNPPAEPGRLVSSVVVGVSNDVPTLAYTVTASDGVTAARRTAVVYESGAAARAAERESGAMREGDRCGGTAHQVSARRGRRPVLVLPHAGRCPRRSVANR